MFANYNIAFDEASFAGFSNYPDFLTNQLLTIQSSIHPVT